MIVMKKYKISFNALNTYIFMSGRWICWREDRFDAHVQKRGDRKGLRVPSGKPGLGQRAILRGKGESKGAMTKASDDSNAAPRPIS
jgi:hypothetical protein